MASSAECFDEAIPIHHHRASILDAIARHDCTIVVGDTGSGKTTQLPRMLLAAGYQRVCVTQPRRVAAIAAARRVADEMGVAIGREVGYAVRFEQQVSERTQITFVTDGVLLRQAIASPQLLQYDAIILDEAHERSLNTDVLFALMKRILVARWAARQGGDGGDGGDDGDGDGDRDGDGDGDGGRRR